MEIYKELVLTSLAPQNVAGNEGLISGVIGLVKKIIQKILDGIKWLWKLLTGGGSQPSVSKLSQEIDADIKRAEQQINEWAKQEEKLNNELKTQLKDHGSVDFSDTKVLDEYMTGKKESNLSSVDKVMTDLFGKEHWDAHKKRTAEKLKEATGKQPSPAKVKKEATKIGVAAATNKPLPKMTAKSLAGVIPINSPASWWLRTKEVCEAAQKNKDKPVSPELVNKGVGQILDLWSDLLEEEIKMLGYLTLFPVDKVNSLTAEELKPVVERFHNNYKLFDVEFWYGEHQEFNCNRDELRVSGKWIRDRSVTPSYEGEAEITLETYEIINKKFKVLSSDLERFKSRIKKIADYGEVLNKKPEALIEKENNSGVVTDYLMLILCQVDASNFLASFINQQLIRLGQFASNPFDHLTAVNW